MGAPDEGGGKGGEAWSASEKGQFHGRQNMPTRSKSVDDSVAM